MKKLYSKNTAVVIITLIIILFSCKKNIQSNPGEGNGSIPGTGNGSVQGVITDLNNSPVSNAIVTGGTATATTDASGKFTLTKVQFYADTIVVIATKNGFFEGSKNFASSNSIVNNAKIQLIPKTVSGSFSATSGGSVTIAGGGSVNFGSGFVAASNGNAYSGNVSVSAHYLDPADQNFSAYAPGDLKAVSANNQQGVLQSFGVVVVEMNDVSGNKLQLASGKTASITLPISSALQNKAPVSVPLWYFDDAKGAWKQEGAATKQGNNYIGVVSHFTFWNVGDLAGSINLSVTFIDSASRAPFANRLVTITRPDSSSKNSYTNSSGTVSGLVPVNEILKMKVIDSCGMTVYSRNIGPFSTDTALGSININDSNCKVSGDTSQYIRLTFNGTTSSWAYPDSISAIRWDTSGAPSGNTQIQGQNANWINFYILNDNALPGNYNITLSCILNGKSYPNNNAMTSVTEYGTIGGYVSGTASGQMRELNSTTDIPFTMTYKVKRRQ
jgi:hypothetical protein